MEIAEIAETEPHPSRIDRIISEKGEGRVGPEFMASPEELVPL
jgi:hypothetical protein